MHLEAIEEDNAPIFVNYPSICSDGCFAIPGCANEIEAEPPQDLFFYSAEPFRALIVSQRTQIPDITTDRLV
jgi:hypothetical protein